MHSFILHILLSIDYAPALFKLPGIGLRMQAMGFKAIKIITTYMLVDGKFRDQMPLVVLFGTSEILKERK